MLRKLTFLAVSAVIAFGTLSFDLPQKSEDPGDRLVGIWEPSNGRSRIKIDRIGNKYYGRVVWLIEPNDADGNPRTDINNPNPDLRNVPLRGFRMCKDFVFQGDDQWSEGTLYDPNNGSTYQGTITMRDENTLDMRGYIGIEAIGRTDVWKRLKMPSRKKK